MCDEWMPVVTLPITRDQYRQLPQNPAYKYEYVGGKAILSPKPQYFHAILNMEKKPLPTEVILRTVEENDYPELKNLFRDSFFRVQPFAGLDPTSAQQAAGESLDRTRSGNDGPLVPQACFLACMPEFETAIGAVFVTLLPAGDPDDLNSYYWPVPPPPDLLERGLGRPHLTWIFVNQQHQRTHVGTALLSAACNVLLELGYTQLSSTFLLGNSTSLLWHWRQGFTLLSSPMSPRKIKHWMRMREEVSSDLT